jgi:hypothetical protein
MARNDGRIEPGQKLSSAISARAWNRAQQAADVVLGERNQFASKSGLAFAGSVVVPCSVSTSIDDIRPGHVVKITGAGVTVTPDASDDDDKRTARAFSVSGEIVTPCDFDHYDDSSHHLGVIVGGTQMPTPSHSRIVRVCIAGMCIARVRMRGGAFIRGPLRRGEEETVESLTGIAEQTNCGPHRLIASVGAIGGDAVGDWCVVLM